MLTPISLLSRRKHYRELNLFSLKPPIAAHQEIGATEKAGFNVRSREAIPSSTAPEQLWRLLAHYQGHCERFWKRLDYKDRAARLTKIVRKI